MNEPECYAPPGGPRRYACRASPFGDRLRETAEDVHEQAAESWRPMLERLRLRALADALMAESRLQARSADTTVEIEALKRQTARLTLSRGGPA